MTPQALLAHLDAGTPWPADASVEPADDLAHAYATALALRALREARGEAVAGYKIGWTNRAYWPRLGVAAPMWGTLHASTIVHARDDACMLALDVTRRPRLEPEIVVGFARTPPPGADVAALFDCLDWLAPGFEIVQSHRPDWAYTPAQTIADSAVHARLVVGRPVPVHALAKDGRALDALLAAATARVDDDAGLRGEGRGTTVLGGPLSALAAFVHEMAATPGATPIRPGELVTTGTWTDAFDLAPGATWRLRFDVALPPLSLTVR